MSTSNRLVSSLFAAIPGFFILILLFATNLYGKDYWWGTYLAALIVLVVAAAFLGYLIPSIFHNKFPAWLLIVISGIVAWVLSLFVLGVLNMTPLCIGQNNGDGNNDFGMCMFMTALSSILYTPVYLGLVAASSLVGHWVLSLKTKLQYQK
jgi:hypothetical protein